MVTDLIRLTFFRSNEIKSNIDPRLLDLILFECVRCVVSEVVRRPDAMLGDIISGQVQTSALEYIIGVMGDMDKDFDPDDEDLCVEVMELVNERMEIIISELKTNNNPGMFESLFGMFNSIDPKTKITSPIYPSYSVSHLGNQFMIMTY